MANSAILWPILLLARNCAAAMPPILSRGQAAMLFEIAGEMALIADADLVHNLFHAQRGCFEQFQRSPQPKLNQILQRRHPGLRLEQMRQPRG